MYCINPESDEPIFCLFDPIGKDEDKPNEAFIDGNQFAKELLYMDEQGKKRIQIWINSEGGSVKEGYSIISAMLKTKTKIDTCVIGIAYSIAGVIALQGRKVEAMDFSTLMFHNPYNPDGSEDKGLEVIRLSLVTAVAGRSGKSEDEVAKIMDATTFYTADEAEAAGLISKGGVIRCNDTNKPRATADAKAKHAYGVKYLNKLLPTPTPKIKHMKTVAKALGLNDEASEDAIASEISKMKNKAQEGEKKEKELEEKAKNAQEELAKFKNEMEEEKKQAKAKFEKEEGEKKDKAKNAAILAAKNKIESVVKAKGLTLKTEEIQNYVDLAGETEETLNKVVATIEAIPTVKKAPTFAKPLNKEGKEFTDEIGIPLIPTAGNDKDGNPIAGDTTAAIAALNSFSINKYKARN